MPASEAPASIRMRTVSTQSAVGLVVGCSALPTEAQLSGVEFFSTYPGMYVPQPLALRHDAGDSAATDLAREVLALTKMNWNNTQFDGRAPITIRPARQVGNILKYVGPDDPVEPRYANYM
jgi:hypothetical protein